MIYPIKHLPQVIPIGIQTESGVGEICFDVKPWVEAFGSLTMSVWLTRPGDSAAYPAENVKLDGNILCWTPNEVDTAISGMGRVEILGFAEGKRKLSGYCDTIIQGTSLSATQDPPDGFSYWVDKVVEAGEQAMAAVDKMPTISEEGTWMLWDPVVKVYADSGLPSQGKAGEKGDNGVGIQSVTQTTTSTEDGGENIVTVTKTDGSKSTFAVMNGRKGKDGTGVTILGSYESVDELKAAHPTGNAGDAYLIDGYLYVWPVKDSAWKNVGKIQGPQGERGPAGERGLTGATGPQGPAGSDGRDGTSVTVSSVSESTADGGTNVVTFSDGKKLNVRNGSKGKDGAPGATGPAGPAGATGPAGETGPAGPTGATGPTGPAGATGPAGKAATVRIGTVTTVTTYAGASVTNSGTETDAVLDFQIPRGPAIGELGQELEGRVSKLETKTKNMAEDISDVQYVVDDLEAIMHEYIIKIGFRMIRLERHLGLTPPVNENIDTTLPGIDDVYDNVFPE